MSSQVIKFLKGCGESKSVKPKLISSVTLEETSNSCGRSDREREIDRELILVSQSHQQKLSKENKNKQINMKLFLE